VAAEMQTALLLPGAGGGARAESGGPWRLEVPCHRGQTPGGRSGARWLTGRDAIKCDEGATYRAVDSSRRVGSLTRC
jgi:hypothetical protein